MATQSSVNLFRVRPTIDSPWYLLLERNLKYMTWVIVGILLVGAVLIGVARFFYQSQLRVFEENKKELTKAINEQITKEGMLVDIKSRVGVIGTIMKTQKSPAPFIDTTIQIAEPPRLTEFTILDNNKVSIAIKDASIEDAITTVEIIARLVGEGKIRGPVLEQLTLDPEGTVTMRLTYAVILL